MFREQNFQFVEYDWGAEFLPNIFLRMVPGRNFYLIIFPFLKMVVEQNSYPVIFNCTTIEKIGNIFG